MNNQKNKLQTAFLSALSGMDDEASCFEWMIFGDGDDGLFNLLGFHSFEKFYNFLLSCGFASPHKVTKKPSFLNTVFVKASHEKFSTILRKKGGTIKFRYLKIGHHHHGSSCETPPPINLNCLPLVNFWASSYVRKWLEGFAALDNNKTPYKKLEKGEKIRTPPTHEMKSPSPAHAQRPFTPTNPSVAAMEKRNRSNIFSTNKRPQVRPRLSSPSPISNNLKPDERSITRAKKQSQGSISVIDGQYGNAQEHFNSPHQVNYPTFKSNSTNLETPLQATTMPRQLFIPSPILFAPPRGDSVTEVAMTDNISELVLRLESTLSVSNAGNYVANEMSSTRLPSFMSPTKASEAREAALFKVCTESPGVRNAVTRVANKFNLKQDIIAQMQLGASKAQRISADAELKKVPKILSSGIPDPEDLEMPHFVQLAESTRHIPKGYDYKYVKNEKPKEAPFHFLVSKGWDVELHHQKKKNNSVAKTVFLVPSRKETIDKTKKSKLEIRVNTAESKVEKFDKKMDPKKTTRFDGGPLTRRLLGALVAFHPKVSSLAWEQSIAFIMACAIIEFGGKLDFEQITKVAPCRETFENCLLNFAVESTLIFTDTIDHAGIYYISHDKGDKLKGNGGCVKLVAAFDDRLESEAFPDGEIIVGALDSDISGETSEDMAENVSHSVQKLDLDPETKCGGVTSDSGGGGNTESGAAALCEKGIIKFADDFLVGNCVMHNMSLEMGVALKKVLMDRKPDSEVEKNNGKRTRKAAVDRNVEQLLYTAFAWEHDVGLNVVREYWASTAEYVQQKDLAGIEEDDDVPDEKKKDFADIKTMIDRSVESGDAFVLMIRGAETRWWTLGEAATILHDTLAMRRFMAKNFDDTKAQNKAQKIAQDFLSLSAEPVLLCDLALLKCFHRFYMAPHLKFYQTADHMTRKAGFQPFSVFNRCHLQELDYKKMLTSWESIPEFKDLCNRLEDIPDDRYDDKMTVREFEKYKISEFLKIASAEHKKMFERWLDAEKLAFLPAFSEQKLGRIVCCRLLGKEMLAVGDDNQVYHSDNHGRDFNLGLYASFVAKAIPAAGWPSLSKSQSHIAANLQLIHAIGEDGFALWDRTNPSTKQSRKGILGQYGSLFTSNQGTERANKDQNMASLNQRKESNSSVRMIAMTYIKELNDTTVVGKKRDRLFRGREKILEMFTRVMGVHQAIENMERKLGTEEFEARKKAIKIRLKETFSKVRVQQQKEKFQKAMKVKHVKSVKEQLSGYDVAPLLQNKLQYGKLFGARNLRLLTLELQKRLEIDTGRPLNDSTALRLETIELLKCASTEPLTEESLKKAKKMGITIIKAAIKFHEKKRYERLDISDDYDSRFFEVLHSPIDQYIYDPVG